MVTRLARFLRRLADRFADPETVPFSPVCCSPVTARCEVAGWVAATARPATPPTQPTTESRANER